MPSFAQHAQPQQSRLSNELPENYLPCRRLRSSFTSGNSLVSSTNTPPPLNFYLDIIQFYLVRNMILSSFFRTNLLNMTLTVRPTVSIEMPQNRIRSTNATSRGPVVS